MNGVLGNGSAAAVSYGANLKRQGNRTMNVLTQPKSPAAILATPLVAAIAVGFASASTHGDADRQVTAKSDRLTVVANAAGFATVEIRGDGVSTLKRIPLD